MEFRLARSTDLSTLLAIRQRSILGLAPSNLSEAAAEARARSPDPIRIACALDDGRVCIGQHHGSVGWIEICGDRVVSLYVDPPGWKRGIGTALLLWAHRQMFLSGHRSVRLEAGKNALTFYERHGYSVVGDALANDAVPMRRQLADAHLPTTHTDA